MALGYRFEINSVLSPVQAKEALRAKKKRWLDPKSGPRGWIVGPFLCMWLSAFNQQGPLVIARIESDNFGTRIIGRAGADLNGTLLFLLLTPVMAWIAYQMHQAGQGSIRAYVVIALVFGLGLPLTLWWNHKDRKQAEALVRFIERTIGPEKASAKKRNLARQRSATPAEGASMIVDGLDLPSAPSPAAIVEAVEALEPDGFVIVQFGDQHFMQTAKKYDGFVLERRVGSDAEHYRVPQELGEEQVIDAFCVYLQDPTSECGLDWEHGFNQ